MPYVTPAGPGAPSPASLPGGRGIDSPPGFSEFQAGLRGSPAKLDGTGIDFSVATLPAHFSEGLVLVMSDLDVAIHRPLGPRIAVSARLGVGN